VIPTVKPASGGTAAGSAAPFVAVFIAVDTSVRPPGSSSRSGFPDLHPDRHDVALHGTQHRRPDRPRLRHYRRHSATRSRQRP
jgi:hypothetical protein